jgi:uncharacterized protein YkwD
VRGLTRKSLIAIGVFAGAVAWPLGASHVSAAPVQGNTTSGTIIKIAAGTGATTTPDACTGALNQCSRLALKFVNLQRVRNGLSKLSLKPEQSAGTGSCVGSFGHSEAMARSGAIWHINAQFPKASFPNSICVHFLHAGENVGESASGNVDGDLLALANLMMSEPHTKSDCASNVNHACNILNPAFHHIGIGVYYAAGATWLTEDFTN